MPLGNSHTQLPLNFFSISGFELVSFDNSNSSDDSKSMCFDSGILKNQYCYSSGCLNFF